MTSKTKNYSIGSFVNKVLSLSLIIFLISCSGEEETPAPKILSFTPQSGIPGESVTVSGENFGSAIADVNVTLGGVPVEVKSVTATTLNFEISQDAVTGNIVVSVRRKSATSSSSFEVFKTPAIQNFSPVRGEAGTQVTITGTNFGKTGPETIVKFNGVSANVISGTSTSVVVEVPESTYTGAITVTANTLTATSSTHFVVPPSINSIEPMTGTTGTEVVITGSAFSPQINDNKVFFNGVEAIVSKATIPSLTVVVPETASTGKVSLEILGEEVESTANFIVTPKITAFSPVEGPVGAEVRISGSGFSKTASENTVQFNGVTATVTQATVNELVVNVPEGASSGDLSVKVGEVTSVGGQFKVIIEALGFGGNGYDVGYAIAVDNDGNYYVGGSFQNQITVEGISLTASGSEEAFIAKFNSLSELQWIKRIGGSLNDRLHDIAVSATGEVILSVDVSQTATYDNVALNNVSRGVAIIKLASDGSIIWSKIGKSAQGVSDIDFDANGDILVTGSYNGVLEFGNVSVTSTGNEAYIAKLNGSSGDGIWIKGISCTSSVLGLGITSDSQGNVFFSGTFQETLNINSTALTSAGGVDSYFGKLDSNGALIWLKQIAGQGWNYAFALDTDASGDVVITGKFDGPTDFGGESVTPIRLEDFYVAKYSSSNGSLSWVTSGGSNNEDEARDISITNNGDIYIVGYIAGEASLGGTNLQTFGNNRDVFVAKLSSSGSFNAAYSGGAGEADLGYGIAVDKNGIMHVTGSFRDHTAKFGITEVENVMNDDVFVWKIKP